MTSHRIFLGFSDIAGYFSRLKKGFDELGVKSDLYTSGRHPFEYDLSRQNFPVKGFNAATSWLHGIAKNNHGLLKKITKFSEDFTRILLFIYALFKYDVFIFGFKNCFFKRYGFADLPILKLFKKKVIFVFYGSDTRPPYICGDFLSKDGNDLAAVLKQSQRIKNDLQIIEKYADYVINHPPTAHFHQKPFVSFLHIGIPTEQRTVLMDGKTDKPTAATILHSPSNPRIKGTAIIREAIFSLQKKGYDIDFVEISGQPNKVVLEALAACDLIVDQLYSTSPMPGLVAEAASFGKPAVICGYYHNWIHEILPPEKVPPSYFCHPDDIEKAIEKLIADREYRLELGQKALHFVQAHWHTEMVAARFLRLIKGDTPEDWFFDPANISYVLGACMPENQTRQSVKSLLATHGKDALLLGDKPELEKKFVEFTNR
jgi:glycosyltransferase involved in cell wall biosynthesis